MKKSLNRVLVFLILAVSPAAAEDLYISSNVPNNSTGQLLKAGRNSLKSIEVNTAGTASSIALWDGSSPTNFIVKIGSFSTTAARTILLNLAISSGIVYRLDGTAAADVTFFYKLR